MSLFPIKLVAVVLLIVEGSKAATKTKCEVVNALRAQGVPEGDMRDWLCLVKHESSFRYNAKGTNRNSEDHGIFQLNDRYWCDRPSGTTSSTCWRLNTYGCDVSCSNLRNSDISDDADCAVRIKNCKGFKAWYGWKNNCNDVSGAEYDYGICP